MNRNAFRTLWTITVIAMLLSACAPKPTPAPPTLVPTQPPAPTAVPPTAVPPTAAPTATLAPKPTVPPGVPAADVEKLVNGKFNTVDTNLALWNVQPGLGTVMMEYSNRIARLWFAANAANWDMAKYQLDEMLEIQEVGETTRPNRAPMLKAFEDNYLTKLDKTLDSKDKVAFTQAFNDMLTGCNSCHKASSGTNWKSYQYVAIQPPKTDPAFYVDWKGGGQDNYVANPPAAPTAAPKAPPTDNLDAAGVDKFANDKFNTVDTGLALWNIQPGLGTVMIEYGNRLSRVYYAAKAGNWDMAKYQADEMLEIQEVGETTRPGRAPMLKAFEDNYLAALDKAIGAKDAKAFDDAFGKAVAGCNGCHAASSGANWKSYQFVKIQVPTADNNDYVVWKADKSTGNYIANPPAAATATPKPALTGVLDAAGMEKLVNGKFNTVDTSLALWNIQPGLGTVMMEYAKRMAQLKHAFDAANWDMAKYQLDEMIEIQEVGETTRPGRAPMLKAFEDNYLKALDDAIMAKDNAKVGTAFKSALAGCNACHAASTGANWASYAYVQVQAPQSDPADYVQWKNPGGTGNYISAAPAPGATQAAGGPPKIPADHAGRTQCLVCHATGANNAPKIPTANPDHTAFKDDNNAALCFSCHTSGQSTAQVARPSNPGGPGPALNLTGDVKAGAQIYTTTCVVCHGAEGRGEVKNPGSTDGTVPPLNPIDETIANPDVKVFAYNIDLFLEHGSTPDGPNPALKMVAWGDNKQLTPQQIADVIAYVISLNK